MGRIDGRVAIVTGGASGIGAATLHRLATERAIAAVTVLHEPNLTARYADRILLLGPERPIALGSPRDVITADHLAAAYGIPFRVFPHPELAIPVAVPA